MSYIPFGDDRQMSVWARSDHKNAPSQGKVIIMSEARHLALPRNVTELLALRKSLKARNLNDDVEAIHLRLWEQEDYQKYFEPIWRDETIEGTFQADDIMAAQHIRNFALTGRDYPLAARAKLNAIVNSLGVVLRRYGISRKERQNSIGGANVNNLRREEVMAAAE